MANNTALWAWFLFESSLSPTRAKELLVAWEEQGLALDEALSRLPQDMVNLGLTASEAQGLRVPAQLMPVTGLTWHNELYPTGLHRLPLKARPAILFYRGEASLLARPLALLAPTPSMQQEDIVDLLEETLSLILGEAWLIGVLEETPQATLLLNELIHTEGEAALFLRSGLEARDWRPDELDLLQERRLIALSPLPPKTAADPAWTPLLEQVAIAAADRVIVIGSPEAVVRYARRCRGKPLLGLTRRTPTEPKEISDLSITNQPTDVLLWLADESALTRPILRGAAAEATGSYRETTEPSRQLSPNEILAVLESGGRIPEALKRRLISPDQRD